MSKLTLKHSLLCCSLFITSTHCLAWGQQGHRVTGQIAESYLTAQSKQQLSAIMGAESLAESATYPDEMRASKDEFWQKTANPYHYVTLADGEHYHNHDAPDEGDAVTALKKYTEILQNNKSSVADKQLAVTRHKSVGDMVCLGKFQNLVITVLCGVKFCLHNAVNIVRR